MALSIGELVAYLKTDDTQLRSGLNRAQGRLGDFGDEAKRGLATAGAAAGVAIGVGIAQNLDIGAGRAKLAAQLDLSAEDSGRIGAVAGKVYANNFGENLDEINTAIKAVNTNIGNVSRMSSKELQGITESALALASTFDVDLNTATEAAGKMIKNGLAKDSTEAFDIMTRGFQLGIDQSGDFLETLNEYSPQFAKLGIDGPHALTLLSAGLKAGARDTDTIADAFKEFSLRAIDGSKGTSDGFKAIGLDAKKAAKDIAAGGPAAQQATMTTLQALRQIKDPIKQNAAGVALFGTQWEDALRQILPAIAGAEEGMEGVEGATKRMADTAGASGKAKIETMKRSVEQWIQQQTSATSALGTTAAAVVAFGGPAFAMAGTLGQVATGLAAVNAGAMLSGIWTAVAAAGTKVWAAAQWILNAAMSANPIGLVVIAIAALVAGIIYAWKNSETFRTIVIAAWSAIKSSALAVFGWLGGFLSGVWSGVVAGFRAVVGAVGAVVDWFRRLPGMIMAGLAALPGLLWGVVVGYFRTLAFLVGYELGLIVRSVLALPGLIMAGLGLLKDLIVGAFRWIWSTVVMGWIKFQVYLVQLAARLVVDLIAWIGSLPGKALAFFRALWSGSVALVRRLAADVAAWTASAVNGAISWFRQLPGRATSAIKALPGQIKGVFSGAGRWLLSAGRDLVVGLVHGITGAAGAAMNAVRDLGGRMLGGFKSAMGISSPSRVFAEAGRWIPAGIAQGVTAGMPAVVGALAATPTTLPGGVGSAASRIPAPRSGGIGMSGGAPAGRQDPSVLQLKGSRDALAFMRALIKDFYGGDVVLALGS